MKSLVLVICLLLVSIPLKCQWEWAKVFPKNHRGLDAKIDSKGNFYIISNNNLYQQGPYVIYKLDNNADYLGEKVLPDNLNCTGFEMRSDDKLFIGGYFTDTLQIDQNILISKGKEDGVLIGLNSNLVVFDVRIIGGKLSDRLTGLACDNQNRIYVVGGICDTAQLYNQTLYCNKTGNSFLARFAANLQLDYVVKDSTHENTHYDHGLFFSSVQINNNNDILVGGVGKGKDYYSFRGTQINIIPNYYYHYYRSFTIHLDSILIPKWSRVDQWGKYTSSSYAGFTTSNLAHFSYWGGPGSGGGTEINLLNSMDETKKLMITPWGGKYSMGTWNERLYFHRSFEILDTTVKDYVQRNELFAVVDTQAVLLDTVAGGIGSCRLLLNNNAGKAYVVGIFIGPVIFGQYTISTGVEDHKIFIAKLGESFKVGVSEIRSPKFFTIGPNPTDHRLWLSEVLSESARAYIVSMDGQKFECRVVANEILLPELPAGVYTIVIDSPKSRITKKIIIQ
jgi:hypothetical protein